MQVMTLKTQVGNDGHIAIDVPTSLRPGEVELVLVVNNVTKGPSQSLSSMIGAARGGYSSPAEADDFLNRERDSWS